MSNNKNQPVQEQKLLKMTFGTKSRSDNTLLTVGFNLRSSMFNVVLKSRRDDTIIVPKCCPCGTSEYKAFSCRRLKPTVNGVLSLRDISPFMQRCYKMIISHSFSLFFLVVLAIFTSCQNRSETKEYSDGDSVYHVSLENALNQTHSVKLSTIGSEIEYIPLETIRASVLARVGIVTLSEDYIFVTDRRSVQQFKRDGSYIRQIGSYGRGPGEYQGRMIMDMSIDCSNGQKIIKN